MLFFFSLKSVQYPSDTVLFYSVTKERCRHFHTPGMKVDLGMCEAKVRCEPTGSCLGSSALPGWAERHFLKAFALLNSVPRSAGLKSKCSYIALPALSICGVKNPPFCFFHFTQRSNVVFLQHCHRDTWIHASSERYSWLVAAAPM